MSNNDSSKDSEINVGTEGVTLKGGIADDLRMPIKRAAGTADSILRLLDNVVGLPTDFLSTHLERFRNRYREEVEKIPEEQRQQPSFRTGCSVLRHVAYAAEEPELQELFAKLLATASDKTKQDKAHPGFASVINDLTSVEANILLAINRSPRPVQLLVSDIEHLGWSAGINEPEVVNRAISNLLRLGLIEWVVIAKQPSNESLERIVGKRMYHSPYSQDDVNRLAIEAVNDLQNMKNSVIKVLQQQRVEREIRMSSFGKQFVAACVPDKANKEFQSPA